MPRQNTSAAESRDWALLRLFLKPVLLLSLFSAVVRNRSSASARFLETTKVALRGGCRNIWEEGCGPCPGKHMFLAKVRNYRPLSLLPRRNVSALCPGMWFFVDCCFFCTVWVSWVMSVAISSSTYSVYSPLCRASISVIFGPRAMVLSCRDWIWRFLPPIVTSSGLQAQAQ